MRRAAARPVAVGAWSLGLAVSVALAAVPLPCARAAAAPRMPELALGTLNPDGYRDHAWHAPVPATHPDASTVDTAEAHALLERGAAVPIDVMAAIERPASAGLPAGFIPNRPRRHIPGSVWLPNVGYDEPSPALACWYARALERVSGGDRGRGLLIYCIADCWLSWNAVHRAASFGYTRLYWYPEGSDGWAEAGLALVEARPEPPPPP